MVGRRGNGNVREDRQKDRPAPPEIHRGDGIVRIAQPFAFGGKMDKMRKERYITITYLAGLVEGGVAYGGTESL